MRNTWEKLTCVAAAEVEATRHALPALLRERAEALPVMFERRPNRALRREGIEPDTLGLFVGNEFPEEESSTSPMPPQIILYLDNLWDQAGGQDDLFREEVRITFLHELGHYLGLDEEDLAQRGLE
jgi:predicted Zn-dependent protease with MMP-like domain